MGRLAIGRATRRLARDLAPRLRPEDQEEIAVLCGPSVEDELISCLDRSVWAAAVFLDGKTIGMFGVCPHDLLGGLGIPWFVGSKELLKYPCSMVKVGQRVARRMLLLFPELKNVIPSKYERSVRWAQLVGFEVYPEIQANGVLVRPIRMGR